MSDALTTTPEFIRWTIARQCPLRDVADWESPEWADRQLRALRAYSEAVAEGRFFEGLCVEAVADPAQSPTHGFRADEVLAVYGGYEYAVEQCRGCSANAVRTNGEESLAGCYGLFELSFVGEELHSLVDEVVEEIADAAVWDAVFLPTRPRWYGLWTNSPLTSQQLDLHEQLARALAQREGRLHATLQDWIRALATARKSERPLHVRLYPRGEIHALRWTVAAHCPRCSAERSPPSRVCAVCGIQAHALPARRRHLRGSRPYRPLRDFMSEVAVRDFLERYGRWRSVEPLD